MEMIIIIIIIIRYVNFLEQKRGNLTDNINGLQAVKQYHFIFVCRHRIYESKIEISIYTNFRRRKWPSIFIQTSKNMLRSI
jgi:hypothetical protein